MRMLMLCFAIIIASPALAGDDADSKAAARAMKDGADFRSPPRNYVTASGPFRIHVESSLIDRNPELGKRAVAKLRDTLSVVFEKLPEKSRSALATVNFHLMWGKGSPLGGRANGMSYIRKGEPKNYPHLDPRWEHSIVVFSADNLIHLDELWTRKALTHELAHAWHITHWPDKHPPIYDAWRGSQDKQLYRNVNDYKGKTLPMAYAGKNQLEYFAELSAIYFVGGNYHPFNRTGLRVYDPTGYAMIESLWDVTDARHD